MKFKGMEKKQV